MNNTKSILKFPASLYVHVHVCLYVNMYIFTYFGNWTSTWQNALIVRHFLSSYYHRITINTTADKWIQGGEDTQAKNGYQNWHKIWGPLRKKEGGCWGGNTRLQPCLRTVMQHGGRNDPMASHLCFSRLIQLCQLYLSHQGLVQLLLFDKNLAVPMSWQIQNASRPQPLLCAKLLCVHLCTT